MPSRFKVNVICLFLSLTTLRAFSFGDESQNISRFFISHYDDKSGLPQSSIKNLVQDDDGFIWLGTENGLVRFDGQKFQVFNKSNSDLPSNRISYIHRSARSPFKKFYVDINNRSVVSTSNAHIHSDTVDYKQILDLLPDSIRNYKSVYFSMGLPDGFSPFFFPDIYIIQVSKMEGEFFVLGKSFVYYFRNWKIVNHHEYKLKTWSYFRLGSSLFYLNDDKTYLDVVTSKIKGASLDSIQKRNFVGDIIKDELFDDTKVPILIYWNNSMNQVFVSLKNRIYRVVEDDKGFLSTRLILDGFDLGKNLVINIYEDPSNGVIYLGSGTKGLFVLKKKMFYSVLAKGGGWDNVFYAQEKFGSNTIQTPRGLVLGKDPGSKWKHIERRVGVRSKMDGLRILVDNDKNTWTVKENTVTCFDKSGKYIQNQWTFKDRVSDIFMGFNNTIWVALARNLLFIIDAHKLPSEPRLVANLNLPATQLNFIVQPTVDQMWIGTDDGLFQFSLFTHKLRHIRGTAGRDVGSLHISPGMNTKRELWITSHDGGLMLLKDGILTPFPMDPQQYLSSAHYIFEDRAGFFWVPTNKGLFQISKQELLRYAAGDQQNSPAYRYYDSDDGFLTNEFNGRCRPCAVRLDNGYVSIPSLNGLVWFKPEKLQVKSPDRPLFIDRIEAAGKSIPFRDSVLILSQKYNEVKLFLTTPFFGHPNNIELGYALLNDGREPKAIDWARIDPIDGFVNLSRLGAGEYTLFLRKRINLGHSNYVYRSIRIQVAPEWYETWLFRISMLIAVVALFWMLLVFRTRRFQLRNIELETKVIERTLELHEMLASLRSSEDTLLHQLRLHVRMIASISHDVRAPVNYIGNASDLIHSLLQAGRVDNAFEVVDAIKSTSKRISNLLDTMVTFTKSELEDAKISFQNVRLSPLLTEKADLFKHILLARKVNFSINVSGHETVYTNAKLLSVIIHNLIDNAIKASVVANILMRCQDKNGRVVLMISDSGPGLPENLLEWINVSSAHGAKDAVPKEYEGLGLMIIKEISDMLGLHIYAYNDNGAHFCLTFPLASL